MRVTLTAVLPKAVLALICFILVGIPALRHTFGAAQETRSVQLTQAIGRSTSPAEERLAKWRFTTDWSLPPEDCIEFLMPGVRGYTSYQFDTNPYKGRMGSDYQVLRQHSVHIGWFTLLLAVLAFCVKAPKEMRSERLFWAIFAGMSLLLAFGKYTPLYQVVWELPCINQIRAPVKWLHLTGFACAILAGFGAESLVKRLGNGVAVACCVVIAITGVAVIRSFVFPIYFPTTTELRTLPPQTRIYAAPTYHDFIRAQGHVPVQTPYQVEAALMLKPAQRGFVLKLIRPEVRR
jgi:hypothetical protein